MVIILILLAVLFDFLNGFHDSANVVATVITSGALPPRRALIVAALAEFKGPFLFGVAVATAIGDGLDHLGLRGRRMETETGQHALPRRRA